MAANTVKGPGSQPAPPITANDIFRVQVIGMLASQTTQNTFYYDSGQALGTATRQDQVALTDAWIAPTGPLTSYLAAVTSHYTCTAIIVDVMTQPHMASFVDTTEGRVGLLPPPTAPNQTAAVIRKFTLLRGRRGQGRVFIPAVQLALVQGSIILTATVYNTLSTSLQQALVTPQKTFIPGLYSLEPLPLPPTPPPPKRTEHWVATSSHAVDQVLGTIRRRKPGVGI